MSRAVKSFLPLLLVATLLLSGCSFASTRLTDEAVMATDLAQIQAYRSGLRRAEDELRRFLKEYRATHGRQSRVLSAEERLALRHAWMNIVEFTVALDLFSEHYSDFYRYDRRRVREAALLNDYSAFLAEYATALRLIETIETFPDVAVVIDEAVPGSVLPEGSYTQYKKRFLNIAVATRFAALATVVGLSSLEPAAAVREAMESDSDTLLEYGKGKGEKMTLANAMDMVKQAGHELIFPVQRDISEWMGDTRVAREGESLISAEQIEQMKGSLQPGDILLERREWYLSNIGLPGFWSHAALYVGTDAERAAHFGSETVNETISEEYPKAYRQSLEGDAHGNPYRLIEAISEGVVFTSLEHSAAADSLVVLRPKLSKSERAAAIIRAFEYVGRPYDFDFDFQTDAALVCTELVYKAYQGGTEGAGLRLPMEEVLGRLTLPANTIAKLYDREAESEAGQLEMVLFFDGSEYQHRAVEADEEEFRASWRRPKWHILVTDVAKDAPRPEEQ